MNPENLLNITKALKRVEKYFCGGKAKLKQSHYRPGQALRVPGG
jgi:hypothetical protein